MACSREDYWRNCARGKYGVDGAVVHDDASVDESPDDGVWVEAYLWLERADYDPPEDDEATPSVDPAGVCEWMSEDDPMKYR